MRRGIAAVLLLPAVSLPMPGPAQAESVRRVVGYLPSWSTGGPGGLPAHQVARLTHLTYAFAVIDGRGEVRLAQAGRVLGQLAALKRRQPGLRTLLAVGGSGSGSRPFAAMARTPEGRQRFAASCARLIYDQEPGALDGLTIDWEYPGGDGQRVPGQPGDRANHAALLAELRRTLDARGTKAGRRAILATTLPGRVEHLAGYDLTAVNRLVDFADVMAFDYAWEAPRTGHNAPLVGRVDVTVQALRRAGLTPARLNLGLPFYGRSWQGVRAGDRQGLDQPGRPADAYTYRALAASLAAGRYQRHWDATAQVPFLFHPAAGTWISYDDARSVAAKVRYAGQQGLGGVFVWHLGADDRQGTLLQAAATALAAP